MPENSPLAAAGGGEPLQFGAPRRRKELRASVRRSGGTVSV